MSVLTKSQERSIKKVISIDGAVHTIKVNVRHDDRCDNGHNTFSITGMLWEGTLCSERNLASCGCIHEDINNHFPELRHLIKWHLTSTDGPMHYIANTVYHASASEDKEPNLEGARSSAVWPDATLEQLSSRAMLEERLPQLMEDFRNDIEAFGFKF